MTVLVTGASSQIGYFLIPRLLQAGHQVIALSRKDRPEWIALHKALRWCTSESLDEADLAQVERLVSTGPLSLTLSLAERCGGLQGIVAVSTSSIRFKHNSSHSAEARLINSIIAEEQQLRDLSLDREVPCAVLRPTLVYGAGLDSNLCLLASLAERFGVVPVAGKANGMRQPVHADDLAQACVTLLEKNLSGCWYAGGATQLTYREMAETVCRAVGKGRLVRLPVVVWQGLLALVKLTGRYRSINGNMFARQQRDMCVNNVPAENDWGWRPRAFSVEASVLRPPATPFRAE